MAMYLENVKRFSKEKSLNIEFYLSTVRATVVKQDPDKQICAKGIK